MSDSSLMNVLPNFNGNEGECIKFFLDQFNAVANLENWNNTKKLIILKNKLSGKALEFLINDAKASVENNPKSLEELLVKKFRKSESFASRQENFFKISQKASSTVKEIAEEIENAANKFIPESDSETLAITQMRENLKLTKFIDALRPDIRCELKKLGPSNFEKATEMAKNIEKALNDPDNFNSNLIVQNCQINTLLQQQLADKLKIERLENQLKELANVQPINNIQQQPSTSGTNNKVFCHICGKSHLTTKCWKFPGNSSFRDNRRGRQNFYSRTYPSNLRRGRNFRRPNHNANNLN